MSTVRQFIRSYLSVPEGRLLHPQFEDVPCEGDEIHQRTIMIEELKRNGGKKYCL